MSYSIDSEEGEFSNYNFVYGEDVEYSNPENKERIVPPETTIQPTTSSFFNREHKGGLAKSRIVTSFWGNFTNYESFLASEIYFFNE